MLMFEFLIKCGKDQDLKKKNSLLGVSPNSDNPPSIVERLISKKKFDFGRDVKVYEDYFIKESNNEYQELSDQLTKLQKSLEGLTNPIEEYFFNGNILNYVGPCKSCNYESLSILEFSFFELNYVNSSSSFFSRNEACELSTMINRYFKKESVCARCKNQ